MTTRTYCEFNGCGCSKYNSTKAYSKFPTKADLCRHCKHGKVWHKLNRTEINVYKKEQFQTTRQKARCPIYTEENIRFCDDVDNLPA